MRAYRARLLWSYMERVFIYLCIGGLSAILAFGLSSPFGAPFAGLLRIIVFVACLLSVEVLVIKKESERDE